MNNQTNTPKKSAPKQKPAPKKQSIPNQNPASNQKTHFKQKAAPKQQATTRQQVTSKQKTVLNQQPATNQKNALSQKAASAEKLKQQLHSAKADASGLRFEQTVANYFRKKGWNPQLRVEMLGYEFDLFDENNSGWQKSYLVVECKNKGMVSANDICHFIVKVTLLNEKLPSSNFYSKPQLLAYLCHTGEVDKDAEIVAKTHNPPVIMLKFQE